MFLLVSGRHVGAHSDGHQLKTAETRLLARLLIWQSSIIPQILDENREYVKRPPFWYASNRERDESVCIYSFTWGVWKTQLANTANSDEFLAN